MPTLFLSHRLYNLRSALSAKQRAWSRRAYLRYCLQTLPLSDWSMEKIALDRKAYSEEQLRSLGRQLYQMGEKLRQRGTISAQRWQEIADRLSHTDWVALEETLSPYHELLANKAFYACSAPSTRRILRRHAADFAKRHRLPPESAALLWKGERSAPHRALCLFLLSPILPAFLIVFLLFRNLPPWVAIWSLLALPSALLGGYLLSATLLNRFLPSSPLPLLQSGEGHPTLVVAIGRMEEHTAALTGMERILHAGNSDCRYLLILTHSDALLSQCAGEEEIEKAVRKELGKWKSRYDLTVDLFIIPRTYDARHKKWRGHPTLDQITPYIMEELTSDDEAVCILPTDGILLPGTVERLCASLFHPLFAGNALSFLYPNESPLPHDRLAKLRRVLLQKMDAPADFNGYGMLRADCIRGFAKSPSISPRLSGETLYCQAPSPLIDTPPSSPRCYGKLCLLIAVCHPLILWGLIHHAISPLLCLIPLALSLSDLWVSMALSLPRKNRTAVFYTRPSLIRLWKECALRFLLPTKGISDYLKASKTVQYLLTLLFGCAVIASGAPLSFLGIFWIFAPILFPAPLLQPALTPMEKAACHALSKEIAEKLPLDEDTLPLSVLEEDSPTTTPITLGLYGSALLSIFTLGLCDHLTFQRQIASLLNRLEELPHKCGLPYASYRIDDGAVYENGYIDSYSCGIYALCLCQLEAALLEYASVYPAWSKLARQANRISARMDFHLLLTPSGELCQQLTPSGEQTGELRLLCEQGGLTWFSALSSDSLLTASPSASVIARQKRAFSGLVAPPSPLCKGECSPEAWSPKRLWDHLLPLLLLPIPKGSPMDYGADLAIRQIPRGKHLPIGQRLRQRIALFFTPSPKQFPQGSPAKTHRLREQGFSSLLRWPRLAQILGSASKDEDSLPSLPLRAAEYCLLLSKKPRYALAHLQILQKSTPTGGFEADGAADDSRSSLSTDALCLGLIAMENAIRSTGFAKRIQNNPRSACLTPLLSTHSSPHFLPPLRSPDRHSPTPLTPPPVLLGEGKHGLLVSRHGTLSVWENGRPITASQEAEHGLIGGRPTGLLLRRGDQTPSVSYRFAPPSPQNDGTPEDAEIVCSMFADTHGNWVWKLHQAPSADTDLRLIFCPSCKVTQPMRLTTITDSISHRIRLLMEFPTSLAVVLEAEGLAAPFTHADPSPLPKGTGGKSSIFDLSTQTASGLFYTPTCILGGKWNDSTLTIRIATASAAADALRRLDALSEPCAPAALTPKGNHSDALVLAYYLSELFAGRPLPHHTAISHEPLARCLENVTQTLLQMGFPMEKTLPRPLSVSHREGVEGLFYRLLTPPPIHGETPMLPMEGKIHYPDGYLHLLRGRNDPPISHTIANPWLYLDADPMTLRLRSLSFSLDLRITLTLRRDEHPWLLPEACTEISYLPGKISMNGDGFSLTLALLHDYPVLMVELCTDTSGELAMSPLLAPDHTADNCSFWHLTDTQTLFLHSWNAQGCQVWLIGAFERSCDRLFYEIRQGVTMHTYHDLLSAHCEQACNAAQVLQVRTAKDLPPLPSLPAIALAVLSVPSPARALLAPLCTPKSAKADLLAIGRESSLLLPAALLVYLTVFPHEMEICQTPIPTAGGSESLYLRAARSTEQAMENAPQTPLLPRLVSAFAKLAARLGDPAASLYEAFAPPASTTCPSIGKDPHWNCQRSTLLCLQALEKKDGHGVKAVWDALSAQLPTPTPEDSALLWSGVLWTVLGFSPKDQAASFAPMATTETYSAQVMYKKRYSLDLIPPPQTSPSSEKSAVSL